MVRPFVYFLVMVIGYIAVIVSLVYISNEGVANVLSSFELNEQVNQNLCEDYANSERIDKSFNGSELVVKIGNVSVSETEVKGACLYEKR